MLCIITFFCYINYYTYIYLYSYSWICCKPKTYNFNKNSLYTVNIFSSHVGIIIIILLFHVTSGVFFLKSRLSSTNFFLEVSDSSWRSASSVAVTSNDFYEGYRKKTMRWMIVWIDFMYNGWFLYRQFALSRPDILGFTRKTKEYKQSKRWLLLYQ